MKTATFPPISADRSELLIDGSDHQFRQLVHDLLTVSVRMQHVRDDMAARIGVTGPQYNILMFVAHFAGDEGVSVKDTAEHLHVSGAFVTGEVKKLIRVDFLEKETDAVDRRRVRLRLTATGRRQVEAISPALRELNDSFFGALSEVEFSRLSQIAARLVDGSERALDLIGSKSDVEAST